MNDNDHQLTSVKVIGNEKFSDPKWKKLFNKYPDYKCLFEKNKELIELFELHPEWGDIFYVHQNWLEFFVDHIDVAKLFKKHPDWVEDFFPSVKSFDPIKNKSKELISKFKDDTITSSENKNLREHLWLGENVSLRNGLLSF